jgi:hypothetical protein
VVNSAGKVLDWVLMFDDDRSVLAFLDHALKRFASYPDARRPVAARRYMKFPSARLADVEDNGKAPPIIDRHPPGTACPAQPPLPRGTVVARLFGRALGKDGKPVADTVRQEHYVEDRFHVPVRVQRALAKALAGAGTKRFRVGDDLARLLVGHAYLGQLDVNPLGGPGGKGEARRCEFWAQKVDAGGPVRLRVEGRSEAAGASREGEGGDGRLWRHEVKLAWEGLIELQEGRVTRLLLLARGSEKLRWGNTLAGWKGGADVTRLPAGRPIDLACEVRYGIIGEPAPAGEAGEAAEAADVPPEARRQLTEALGPPFLVFRARVQKELGLSAGQKEKLERRLEGTAQDAMRFFQKLEGLTPQEREKELHAYRRKAHEKLAAFLKDNLKGEQLKRLRQIELQQEGPFALGRPDVGEELKLTDEQRKRFMALVQGLQRKVEPLVKEAQEKGNPEEVRPRVLKIRQEHAGKVEAILTGDQKKRWKEMLGKPFALDE